MKIKNFHFVTDSQVCRKLHNKQNGT